MLAVTKLGGGGGVVCNAGMLRCITVLRITFRSPFIIALSLSLSLLS